MDFTIGRDSSRKIQIFYYCINNRNLRLYSLNLKTKGCLFEERLIRNLKNLHNRLLYDLLGFLTTEIGSVYAT